ncbi:MAG: aminotransferase class V-fold PLP-dependent enzyme [Wenzhouxiangellaceae bacterium]|nr:aminotransferase class V-fold PLP-dependent enzyme [Wenzhouxiangellaceae bacterium]
MKRPQAPAPGAYSAADARLFPVIDRHTWLNHAAISPWPQPVIDAMRGFVEDNARFGPLHYADWMAVEARLREQAAAMLRADRDDIALVKNTSDGLCMIAGGLEWQPGDAVIWVADDFPSNCLPWQQRVPPAVRRCEVRLQANDPEASILAALDADTRLVAISSVHYGSGLCLDLERIGRACRAHGALLVVDAIQQLGALPLRVDELPVDFVVAGSHKWLMAPEGLALFWSHPEARRQLTPTQPGWRMWPDMFNFDREDWTPPTPARRFEPGTLNMAGIHGLAAALELINALDPQACGEALRDRSERLIDGLQQLTRSDRIHIVTPRARTRRAGIVSFRVDGRDSAELVRQLAEHDVHAAVRGPWVRLSPHWYTPMVQIDQALGQIDALLV